MSNDNIACLDRALPQRCICSVYVFVPGSPILPSQTVACQIFTDSAPEPTCCVRDALCSRPISAVNLASS